MERKNGCDEKIASQEQKPVLERVLWMDLLRIIATWCVICLHVRGPAAFTLQPGTLDWIVVMLWGMLAPWCVPVFFMLSGALVLSKKPTLKKVLLQRIPRLIGLRICTALSMLAIGIAVCMRNRHLKTQVLWDYMKQDAAMWFVLVLSGLYMIAPILFQICQNRRTEEYFIALCIAFGVILPTAGNIPIIGNPIMQIVDSFSVFMAQGYVVYFVLGHYIYTYGISARYIKIGIIASAIVLNIVVLILNLTETEFSLLNNEAAAYSAIPNMVYAISIFLLFQQYVSRIKWSKKLEKWIQFVGKHCIGIYALHCAILEVFRLLKIDASAGHYTIGVFLMTTVVFGVGMIGTITWRKIPLLKKALQ